jgi:hypothetical protein
MKLNMTLGVEMFHRTSLQGFWNHHFHTLNQQRLSNLNLYANFLPIKPCLVGVFYSLIKKSCVICFLKFEFYVHKLIFNP